MGKIVMPKNSALLNEIEAVLQIYFEAGDWLPNEEYKTKLKAMIGDDQYSSSYTKKAQITSYFGLTESQDIHTKRITESGRMMYEAIQNNDTEKIQDVLMNALETVQFGRNNDGCPDSNSDVEPPSLFVRASLDLGYLTYREFAYLLWKLEDVGGNYTDCIADIRSFRSSGQVELGTEAQKYTDAKPIMILVRWGFLSEDEEDSTGGKHIVVNAAVRKKYEVRLKNLKIYNVDKEVFLTSGEENDAEENERRFRLWLSKQITASGKLSSPSSISNNCSALKKVFQLMDIVEYPDLNSIFEILDIDVFVDVKNIILSHPDFSAVNSQCNNRFLSTGLKWYEKYLNELYSAQGVSEDKKIIDETQRIADGANIILYGVPGSGKSWTIEHEYCHEGSVVERLVFHPDYTNADFIGQILPVVDADKQVTYEFTPGPFTTVIRDAYRNPDKEYVLVIEEINRGNAPAIFGEVFQLLDRTVETKTIEGITYKTGTSEYGITHKYMAENIYGDSTQKVRIPSNLSIVATMNTSDQNVFTLDTAFQRRWRMRLIENNFDNVRTNLASAEILDTEVTWKRFCETVNERIIGNKSKMASAEDKRLGVYFIHEKDIVFDEKANPSDGYTSIYTEYNDLLEMEASGKMPDDKIQRLQDIREALMNNRMFPEKVIKYLWDDAFKFNPEALFDTDNMESLEQVIRTFVYSSKRDRFKIFKPTVRATLYPDMQA